MLYLGTVCAYALGFVTAVGYGVNQSSVAACLLALAASFLLIYFRRESARLIIYAAFLSGSLFLAELCPFYCCAAYFMGQGRRKYLIAAPFVFLIINGNGSGAETIAYTAVSCAVCFVMGLFFESIERLNYNARLDADRQREAYFKLNSKNKELERARAAEVNNATLKERERIAVEMHDNAGHMLSRALLMTGAIIAENKDGDVASDLEALKDTLNSAMDSIRSSVHKLKDESINLERAVKECAAAFPNFDCRINYSLSGDAPAAVKYFFASAVREGFSNAARHSDAKTVRIYIEEHPAFYKLVFADDGTNISAKPVGMGLSGIEERARAMGGRLNIDREGGFKLHVVIPKVEVK